MQARSGLGLSFQINFSENMFGNAEIPTDLDLVKINFFRV